MINGYRPTLGPNAGRKAQETGSARARRCFRCARPSLLHRMGANSLVNDLHLGNVGLIRDVITPRGATCQALDSEQIPVRLRIIVGLTVAAVLEVVTGGTEREQPFRVGSRRPPA